MTSGDGVPNGRASANTCLSEPETTDPDPPPVIAERAAPDTFAGAQGGQPDHDGEPAGFHCPPLGGKHVRLRPIVPGDYAFLQALELGSDLSLRWRLRGKTPSPEQWAHGLWHNVLAQFLVVSPTDERPVGVVMAYNTNFQDGHTWLGVARFGMASRSPVLVLGFAIFVEYIFTCWNFRKLYLDTPEYNYAQFASGAGKYFELEGRLRDHTFFGGRYWDQLTLAMYRERWEEHGARLLAVEWPPMRRVRVRIPPLPGRGSR